MSPDLEPRACLRVDRGRLCGRCSSTGRLVTYRFGTTAQRSWMTCGWPRRVALESVLPDRFDDLKVSGFCVATSAIRSLTRPTTISMEYVMIA
jgi:hypothetical protein